MAGGVRRYNAQTVDIAGVALDHSLQFVFLLSRRLPKDNAAVSSTGYDCLVSVTHEGAATTDVVTVPNKGARKVVRHFLRFGNSPTPMHVFLYNYHVSVWSSADPWHAYMHLCTDGSVVRGRDRLCVRSVATLQASIH